MSPHPDLSAHLRNYFEIVPASTPELLRNVFRLRYQVYCQEGLVPGFNLVDYPDGLEHDSYDQRSLHCLLRHRPSGTCAGTVRIVLANPAQPDAPFPIETSAGERIDRKLLRDHPPSRRSIVEVSRFILARQFRSRQGEWRQPDGLADVTDPPQRKPERRALPHPALGLAKAVVMMSWEQQIQYWYAGMEPRLDRRLRQFGLALRPVSPLIDHHGPCRAYWGCVPEVLAGAREQHPEIWSLLTDNGAIWPRQDHGKAVEGLRPIS